MTKVKKIYKFPTGATIPDGAVYLNTVTQTSVYNYNTKKWESCWLVWHYFLVEAEE